MTRFIFDVLCFALLCGFFSGRASEPACKADTAGTCKEDGGRASSLIPRPLFFGNPDKANVQISPDGKMIAYLSAWEGILNVWVQSVDATQAVPVAVTRVVDRPVAGYQWAYNGHILFLKDNAGDENFHVHAVDVSMPGHSRDLTPGEKVKASIVKDSPNRPNQILIEWNARNEQHMDVGKLDIVTGELTMIFTNDAGYIGMVADENWTVRIRTKMTAEGGLITEHRVDEASPWEKLEVVSADDMITTNYVAFDKSGDRLFLVTAKDADKAFLQAVNLKHGASRTTVFEPLHADVSNVIINPSTHIIEAVSENALRLVHHVLDDSVRNDFEVLPKLVGGDWTLASRSQNDMSWIIDTKKDDGPREYYLYDRTSRSVTFLFYARPRLAMLNLSKMEAFWVNARDGVQLATYLTMPRGSDTDEPHLPTVMIVHGGPWARDEWGYNPEHQWLANRGYAVVSVNYRGSTGFGKNFGNLGNRQWYGTMQDDLNDVAEWLVQQGISDKSRIAIFGASYGGYATLAGLTRDPDFWACGVDIVGPSHVATLINSIPPYWAPMKAVFTAKVGDVEDKAVMKSISPLAFVANIKKPLVIAQGANDPRVKINESDQIVDMMVQKKLPVTYVVFPDEGHGFARPENRMAFYAIAENFLKEHIKGDAEPISDELTNSSADIRQRGGLVLSA